MIPIAKVIKLFTTGLCIMSLLALSACKKDNPVPDQDEPVPSENQKLSEKEKLMISHGWHLFKSIINGHEVIKSNPWDLDDCWIFKADKTFIYSYGSLEFPPGHQPDFTGKWSLSQDEYYLNYGAIVPVKIEKLTSDSLILSLTSLEGTTFIDTYVRCSP